MVKSKGQQKGNAEKVEKNIKKQVVTVKKTKNIKKQVVTVKKTKNEKKILCEGGICGEPQFQGLEFGKYRIQHYKLTETNPCPLCEKRYCKEICWGHYQLFETCPSCHLLMCKICWQNRKYTLICGSSAECVKIKEEYKDTFKAININKQGLWEGPEHLIYCQCREKKHPFNPNPPDFCVICIEKSKYIKKCFNSKYVCKENNYGCESNVPALLSPFTNRPDYTRFLCVSCEEELCQKCYDKGKRECYRCRDDEDEEEDE